MHQQQKSRYRGVYRCGKRWKAQLQSQGVQYYLGTFDSEEEAARAYDRKAREEKGEKSLTNFDGSGTETVLCQQYRPPASPMFSESSAVFPSTSPITQKGVRSSDLSSLSAPRMMGDGLASRNIKRSRLDDNSIVGSGRILQIQILWDRDWQVSQRIILAGAALEKLSELQASSPDDEKARLLLDLQLELSMLEVTKSQLRVALTRSVAQTITISSLLSAAPSTNRFGQDPSSVATTAVAASSSAGGSSSSSGGDSRDIAQLHQRVRGSEEMSADIGGGVGSGVRGGTSGSSGPTRWLLNTPFVASLEEANSASRSSSSSLGTDQSDNSSFGSSARYFLNIGSSIARPGSGSGPGSDSGSGLVSVSTGSGIATGTELKSLQSNTTITTAQQPFDFLVQTASALQDGHEQDS